MVEEFKGKVDCLGENTEKYITFSVPIKKELNDSKVITYKLKFINSCRFMSTSLPSLVDNLSEINKKECKKCMERKNTISEFKFMKFENNRLNYKCKKSNDKSSKSINELIKKLAYQFCNGDLNKFSLSLRKGMYPYEYMDSWEKFNEASLPDKESFYSELNKEYITYDDYLHAQIIWEVFKIKILASIMICMLKAIYFCLQMHLKTLEIDVLIFINLILLISYQLQD